MRQLMLMFVCTIMLTGTFSQEAQAQDTERRHYIRTDLKSHTTYHILIKISGYQVEVWAKATSAARPTAEWQTRKVTYTSEDLIKYNKSGKYNFEVTMDEYCDDIIYVENVTSGTGKNKYFLVR